MQKRSLKILIGLVLILILMISCQMPFGENTEQEPIPPTTAPEARRVPVDSADQPLPETNGNDQYYVHPSGTFEMQVPVGWVIETDESGSVYIYEPEAEGAIYVTVTYTGHVFDGPGFERFVDAYEVNFFDYFNGYTPGEKIFSETKDSAVYYKTVDYNGIPETVVTYYFQDEYAIFKVDTWMETSKKADYEPLYQSVMDSFVFQKNGAEQFYLYNYVMVFKDQLDTFSFEAPMSWSYEYQDREGMLLDRFFAPDDYAIFEHFVIYNIGDLSAAALEETVMTEVQTSQPEITEGMEIYSSTETEAGIYRFEWRSDPGGWEGFIIARIYENNLLFLNGAYASGYEDSYLTTIEYGLDYYSVPAAAEEE